MSQHLGVICTLLYEPCSNPKHKAQASSNCMPKEPQPRKNAYDTYFPLLFAFKFKITFDGVKTRVASFDWRLGGGGWGGGGEREKNLLGI